MDLKTNFQQLLAGDLAPQARADFEQYLFDRLVADGSTAFCDTLLNLSDPVFRIEDDDDPTALNRLVASREDTRIVIMVFEAEDLTSISIDVESKSDSPPPQHPGHTWFYGQWESLMMLSDPRAVAKLDQAQQMVFRIGLFEAEIMNGGIGQYLANSDAVYAAATLDDLESIGASAGAEALRSALALRGGDESWDAVWEDQVDALEALDARILDAAEDYAGLTAHYCGVA